MCGGGVGGRPYGGSLVLGVWGVWRGVANKWGARQSASDVELCCDVAFAPRLQHPRSALVFRHLWDCMGRAGVALPACTLLCAVWIVF